MRPSSPMVFVSLPVSAALSPIAGSDTMMIVLFNLASIRQLPPSAEPNTSLCRCVVLGIKEDKFTYSDLYLVKVVSFCLAFVPFVHQIPAFAYLCYIQLWTSLLGCIVHIISRFFFFGISLNVLPKFFQGILQKIFEGFFEKKRVFPDVSKILNLNLKGNIVCISSATPP